MSQNREQKARQEFAHQSFAAAVAAGRAAPMDRFGKPLVQGALALWKPPHDMVWEATEIKPVLDVRQPPGLMAVTFSCSVQVTMAAGQPVMGLVVVGHQNAPGHAQLDTPQMIDTRPGDAPAPDPDALMPDTEPDPRD